MKILLGIFRIGVVLWAGSLWTLLWVAATVFSIEPDRHAAGLIAARLFSIETYFALGLALLALALRVRRGYRWGYGATALLATNEWILKRVMSLAQAHGTAAGLGFAAWHGVSALLYTLACLCVLVVIYKDDYRDV